MPPEHLLVQHPHGFNEKAASQSLLRTPVEKNKMKKNGLLLYCFCHNADFDVLKEKGKKFTVEAGITTAAVRVL